jgi:hypothetical protein
MKKGAVLLVRPRAVIALALYAGSGAAPPLAAGAGQNVGLRIVVIEGEDAVNVVQQKTAVAQVIEVRDRNDQPVAGALVRFAIRSGRASFNGARAISLTTNAAGRVAVTSLMPTGSGALQITASAAFQGQTAVVTIAQTNVITLAQASAIGAGASSGAGGSAGGAGAGSGTGAAGGAAGGGAGGGISATTVGIIGGAAAGGTILATKVAGGSGNGGTTYTNVYRRAHPAVLRRLFAERSTGRHGEPEDRGV